MDTTIIGDIPYAYRVIVATAGEELAVGAPCDHREGSAMSAHDSCFRLITYLPDCQRRS